MGPIWLKHIEWFQDAVMLFKSISFIENLILVRSSSKDRLQ